jgi:Cof subfamily protein (haloacid dehalogenase superfamily)
MRLVACDLDGTIVRPDFSISERTLAALDACVCAGVRIVFVTGRPPRWVLPMGDLTGHRGLAICGNGAVVLDLAAGRVVSSDPLPGPRVRLVVERIRSVVPGAAFALETLEGYRRESAFIARHEEARAARSGSLPELLADDPTVIKILCRQDALPPARRLDSDGLLALARPVLAGLAEPVHSTPKGVGLLEVAAPGVSKASALAALAARWGVPAAEAVAFGDMPNDVPMLRWAGRGYAMADGHPEAVAAAGFTAPPCLEDGVAQVLEALLSDRARAG